MEKASRAQKKLFDFDDFSKSVSKSGISVEMKAVDFLDFENHLSQGKDTNYPLLKDIRIVQFREGFTKMWWKESHTEFQSGEFIQKKHRTINTVNLPVRGKTEPRGVTSSKLQDILTKIGPVIPVSKRRFWDNMPTNDNSRDLTINLDHLASQEKSKNDVETNQVSTRKMITRRRATR